jgi:hypothetical protein
MAEHWTYTAGPRGYMLHCDGKPMGGAGILPSAKGPRGRAANAQAKSHAETAERMADQFNREGRPCGPIWGTRVDG